MSATEDFEQARRIHVGELTATQVGGPWSNRWAITDADGAPIRASHLEHFLGTDVRVTKWMRNFEDMRSAPAEPLSDAKDAERWRKLRWFWEDERDMGPGGRWWTAVMCDNKPATPGDAIDAT